MALGISRSCFGSSLCHQRLSFSASFVYQRLAACPTSHLQRTYATASAALTKKNPVTAKGTRHDAHPPPPSPGKKAATKEPRKKSTSPQMETARQAEQAAEEAASKKAPSSQLDELAKMKEMERIMAFQHLMPTVDAWGAEVKETLDVMIPHSIRIYDDHPLEIWKAFKENGLNRLKNASALLTLMNSGALPNVYPPVKLMQQVRQAYQAFSTQSVEPHSVLAPVRQMALDIYAELNEAIANRDEKIIKKYTTHLYQKHALDLAKNFRSKQSRSRLIWQLHRTVTPVQILSLRVTQGYFGLDEPRTGNRLMVHALVKFDTEQSLEMYNERGVPLHDYHLDEDVVERPKEPWRVPASRKRVTEYLVLERRMWIPGSWQFREQMWPSVKAEEKEKEQSEAEP